MTDRTPDEIIDELIRARAVNGEFWGDLIRLAWKAAPEQAREISQRINAQDRVVVGLAEELAGGPAVGKFIEEKYLKPAATPKAVLLPGGGVLHTYAVHEALALGLTPIVTDRDPACPCAKIPGVEFHEIDCYDVAGHLDVWRARKGTTVELVGAFCGGADTHVVVAAVHEALGFKDRWVSRKTAETCKDKLLAKEVLLASGVPTAKWAKYRPLADRALALEAGVCKPPKESGSRGVRRHVIGDVLFDEGFLYEELLEGPEQSVEILLDGDGPYVRINIVDRHFRWVDDQPLEWGHTNPSRLLTVTRSALYELAYDAARAVGAHVGFFKCDTIWTKDGPKVLECTPRLSGGFDSQISTPMSSGRNLLRFGLQLACGLPCDYSLLKHTKEESVTVIHRPELATAEVMGR